MKGKITSSVIDLNGFRSIAGHIDDTDSWLSSVSEREDVFEKMRNDSRIESLLSDRKAKVLQMYGSITKGGNKVVDEACDKHLGFNIFYKLNNILLNAVPYGISACEVRWAFRKGLYIPEGFTPIPRKALSFPNLPSIPFGVPVLTAQNNYPLSDERKFLVHRNDDGNLSLWGRPALRSAYIFWKFKQMGIRFWAQAAEKVGVPSILALFETRSNEDARTRAKDLTKILNEWESGSSGAFGNVKDIKIVSAQINDFNTLVETCDTEIAYALTGQSLGTNEAQYGTRAQADTHVKTLDNIIKHDAYLLQQTDQKLVNAFVSLNFPGEAAPTYDIDSTDFADWEVIRDAIDRGIPVSLDALYDKVKIPRPKNKDDLFEKRQDMMMFGDIGSEDFFQKAGTRRS